MENRRGVSQRVVQRQVLYLARIMHEEWNTDRIVDVEKHDCDEWQNLP